MCLQVDNLRRRHLYSRQLETLPWRTQSALHHFTALVHAASDMRDFRATGRTKTPLPDASRTPVKLLTTLGSQRRGRLELFPNCNGAPDLCLAASRILQSCWTHTRHDGLVKRRIRRHPCHGVAWTDRPRAGSWPGGWDAAERGFEVVEADADGASAALVGGDGAVGDAAADGFDREGHAGGCFLEAEVHG